MMPNQTSTETVRSQSATVLVVEDDWMLRTEVADYLRQCGYRVLEAEDAGEALAALHTDDRITVVITDVQMPGNVDGFGLTQWLRRQRPEVGVILTSGVVCTTKAARDLCADGPLMEKPYSHVELERRIRTLLR